MRVLITGREGQVARSLAELVTQHEILWAARPDFDLADAASIERVVTATSPDVIVSAAAYTAVDKAESEPDVAMAINGAGVGVLGRAAAQIGARVIHLSTDYVFDGALGRPWRESDPVAPLSVYGASKLAGERALAASGAHHAIVRTAWVYGPFGANFVKTMLRLAETNDHLRVVEDQLGCPTSSLDIADAIFAMIDIWRSDPGRGLNGIYHLAGRGETNWAGFAREIFEQNAARGGPSPTVEGILSSAWPTAAVRPKNSRLDSSLFSSTFDYGSPDWRQSLGVVMDRLRL